MKFFNTSCQSQILKTNPYLKLDYFIYSRLVMNEVLGYIIFKLLLTTNIYRRNLMLC
jgi:hypothetical protein